MAFSVRRTAHAERRTQNIMKTVGIIGYGNMGSAIAERINIPVAVFDADRLKTSNLKSTIQVVLSAALVVQNCDVIIIAVKPQDFELLLEAIKKPAEGRNKLFISIAAGIRTSFIEKRLEGSRVVRVMPNLPARIGEAMSCLAKGASAKDEDLVFAQGLFNALGQTLCIPEDLMDAATAISGSGPGFFFYQAGDRPEAELKDLANKEFIPKFTDAARQLGFTAQQAQLLVDATVSGSIALIAATGLAAQELLVQVTSKGGTTEAGLAVLQKGGSLADAARAAAQRASELSKS